MTSPEEPSRKPSNKRTTTATNDDDDDDTNKEDKDTDDTAACCLCHAAVDYSDLEWFGQGDDIVAQLPLRWHDAHNALVYCDGCDRMYHQKCHFVPLLTLPRGDWYCLICRHEQDTKSGNSNKKTKGKTTPTKKKKETNVKRGSQTKRTKMDDSSTTTNTTSMTTTYNLATIIYPQLTPDNDTPATMTLSQRLEQYKAELDFEFHSRHLKASLWKQELQTRFPKSISQLVQGLQQAQTELETLTSSHRNRQYFIESTQLSSTSSSISASSFSKRRVVQQQLHQTIYHYTWRKFQLRQALVNLSNIIQDTDQTWQELQLYLQQQEQQEPQQEDDDDDPLLTNAATKTMTTKCFPFGQPMGDTSTTPMVVATRNKAMTSSKKQPPQQQQQQQQHCRRIRRRMVPRTREWKRHVPNLSTILEATGNDNNDEEDDEDEKIPQEIHVAEPNGIIDQHLLKSLPTASPKKNGLNQHHHQLLSPSNNNDKKPRFSEDDGDDDDSGISLDDLQCCVCFKSEASDDNDLILCDGSGCCRAYHVHCLDPPPSSDIFDDEDADWFCPMCSTLAQTLLQVQAQYLQDEDWQLHRQYRHTHHHQQQKDNGDSEAASVKSWENALHAFPEAPWQYRTALLLKQGQHNVDTDRLLRQILGLEPSSGHAAHHHQQEHDQFDNADDEADEEDSNFELDSFEARKRKGHAVDDHANNDKEQEDDENSINSSEATLVNVSSVELEISDDELNALSGHEESGSDIDDNEGDEEKETDANNYVPKENQADRRRSRRLLNGETRQLIDSDAGKLNRDNILWGKRRRKAVDYRRLNDAIFGDLDEEQVANIDDADDFVVATTSSRKTRSTNSSSSSSSSTSGDSDNDEEMQPSDGNDSEANERNETVDESDADDDNSEKKRPPKRRRTFRPSGRRGSDKAGQAMESTKITKTEKNAAKRNSKAASASKKETAVASKAVPTPQLSSTEKPKRRNRYRATQPKTKDS
jgi:hypothetical protein